MTELEAFFKTGDIQFFYLVPRANNPLAMISQAFLEIILKNNLLARYNHTLSTDIKEKKELIHQVSAPWQKQYVQVIDSHSGYYSLICFHPNLSITHLIKELEAKDILITDTKNSFFSPDHPLSLLE